MRPHDYDSRIGKCDECGSPSIRVQHSMSGLCRECAHWLYGKPKCDHEIVDGACRHCGWDGSSSRYIDSLQKSTASNLPGGYYGLSAVGECPRCALRLDERSQWNQGYAEGEDATVYTHRCPICDSPLIACPLIDQDISTIEWYAPDPNRDCVSDEEQTEQ